MTAPWVGAALFAATYVVLRSLKRDFRFVLQNIFRPLLNTRKMVMDAPSHGPPPVLKDLVLVGGGHAHVHVLKMMGMRPMEGVRVTLVTRDLSTPYSGMLPGHVAGHYTADECHIDLAPLARFAKAVLVHAPVVGLDRERNLVLLGDGRPPLPYDVLSINIGSSPKMLSGSAADAVTPVKPLSGFSARWDIITDRVRRRGAADGVTRIVTVGGGAGGVELTLNMQHALARLLRSLGKPPSLVTFAILNRGPALLPGHNAGVRRRVVRICRDRGIDVVTGVAVARYTDGELVCADGRAFAFDECLWCTEAGAQAWLQDTGLQLDDRGFVAVAPTLRSLNTANVFAAGDVAAVLEHPRPKSGVFAVRQGPPLLHNLRQALLGRPLRPYVPQREFMSILGCGDGRAVLSRGRWAFEGQWVWRLKDWIDRKWMSMYQKLPEMELRLPPASQLATATGPQALEMLRHAPMRCGGCGSKVGATVLSRVMSSLDPPTRPEVLVGLDSPDDAAVVQCPEDKALVQTVDFFRSFIDDPYVFGQIAVHHSLSDCHAMGAEPVAALAIVTVPYGLEDKVEATLRQLMAGACHALRHSHCALVGGHTTEGPELTLGFAVTGFAAAAGVVAKGGMRPGDALVLTKGLGTGTLFAADMRGRARGAWVAGALRSMCTSNGPGARVVTAHGASACTDVTGFGLVGHLAEMCRASDVHVALDLDAVPLLPGAAECVAMGIFSSLHKSNARLRRGVANGAEAAGHRAWPLVYDPQTSGGLLASVPAERAEACVAALRREGLGDAAVVGRVEGPGVLPGGGHIRCLF